MSDQGLVYMAIETEKIPSEMHNLFEEITQEIQTIRTPEQAVYYAVMIHVRCTHIHFFADGNRRAAYLLEKVVFGKCHWR